jgi:hypothetical protein
MFQQRPQDLVDPSVMAAPQPLLAPGGRSMSLQALARAGVTLAGRLVAAQGERVAFDDSAPANLAAGDAFAARIRAMLDQVIRRAGLHPVGLRWLTHRASGNVLGFPADAAATADAVVTRLMVTLGGGR